MFGRRNKEKKTRAAAKDAERSRSLAESQHLLLTAAISTADIAQEVTQTLKRHLDDIQIQFEMTAKILDEALLIFDMSGSINVVNPAAERIFGMSKDQLGVTPVMNLFHIASKAPESVMLLLDGLQSETIVWGRRGQDVFPVSADISLLDRSDGSRVVLMLARETPQKSDLGVAYLEATFDSIVVVSKETGVIMAANSTTAMLFGHSLDDVVGSRLSRLMQGMVWFPHVDGENKNCYSGEGRHSNGRAISLLFAITPIQWCGEEALLLTIKDVSDTRLDRAYPVKRDNGIDMVCCYGDDFRITYVNKAFADLYGSKRIPMLGTDVRQSMSDADRYAFMAAFSSLDRDNTAARSQSHFQRQHHDAVQDWIEHAIFDGNGKLVEYQRVGRDIADAIALAISRQP